MRIAIDITPLQTGHKDRGVGKYTELLVEALQKYEKKHSYYLFTRGQKVPKGVELIHYPYLDPFFITLPLFYPKPTVITVHDLIPLVFPDHFPAGIRGSLKWHYQRVRLTRVGRVIADSQATKGDIEHIVGIPASRIDVIHLAPSPQYEIITDNSLLSRVKKKYGLTERFILYVGDVNWNKNVLGMIRAFQKVKAKAKLVLVGKSLLEDSQEAREIEKYIENERLDDTVMRIGHVPVEDLVAIYNVASVYLQPSLYEGFGLSVLEAMACGVPVVSSRAASLTEIAGPAIAIDPGSSEDIARGIKEALTLTHAKRTALIVAQNVWIRNFTWQKVAHETVRTYEKALE